MNGAKAENSFRVWNAKFEKAIGRDSLPSVQMARNYFLKAVAEHAPEVLQDLSREPFRRFRATNLFYEADTNRAGETSERNSILEKQNENPSQELFNKHFVLTARRFAWTRYERPDWKEIENPFQNPLLPKQPTLIESDSRIADFADSLFVWSIKHNLNALWCRQMAFETLDYWCSLPEAAPKVNFNFTVPIPAPVSSIWTEAKGSNKFKTYETAYPAFGINADEEKTILEFCERKEMPVNRIEVREFLNQCEVAARDNQFTETPRRHSIQHFDWLALYQCAGWSGRKIAERINQKPPTVSGEIKNLADFCEIQLRKPERGRPKKEI